MHRDPPQSVKVAFMKRVRPICADLRARGVSDAGICALFEAEWIVERETWFKRYTVKVEAA